MMNARVAIIVFAAIALGAWAFAMPRPKPIYGPCVTSIRNSQKNIPAKPVYIDGTIASPGAYKIEDGMTVAQLVQRAGGIKGSMTQIELLRKGGVNVTVSEPPGSKPIKYSKEPDFGHIFVYRPTTADPGHVASYCELNLKVKSDRSAEECRDTLKENDLVFVFVHRPGPIVIP